MFAKISGIYAIIPDAEINFKKIENVINNKPINILQYRRKINDFNLKIKEAVKLQAFCKEKNILFIVNDDIKLSKTIKADGVHLGKNDIDIVAARKFLGENFLIGVSCYNEINLAINAQKNGANYCAFGSIFTSTTKLNTVYCPLETITKARQKITIPIVGIGGINFHNMDKALNAGCDSVAMINALW